MQIHVAPDAIPRTIISESSHVDFTDSANAKLEGVTLLQIVNMIRLKPFRGRLWLFLDLDKKTVILDDTINRSFGTGKIELVLEPTGPPSRVFVFEPKDTPYQCWGYGTLRPFRSCFLGGVILLLHFVDMISTTVLRFVLKWHLFLRKLWLKVCPLHGI